jgi:DNA polymerase III epsilon subunit-like protein
MSDKDEAADWARGLLADDFVIMDTETTGLYSGDEIVQLAVIDKTGAVLLDSLLRPTQPIPRIASSIHGITDAMVEGAPTFEELYNYLLLAIGGKRVAIYNATFDIAMLTSPISCISSGAPRVGVSRLRRMEGVSGLGRRDGAIQRMVWPLVELPWIISISKIARRRPHRFRRLSCNACGLEADGRCGMSEEIAETNSLLTELAHLRTDLEITRDVLAQAQRENAAERVARIRAEADAAAWLAFVGGAARHLENGARCAEIQSDLFEAHYRAIQGKSPGAPLLADLEAAYHALLSYAHGNSAPDLAQEVAEKIGHWIGKESGT